MDVGTILGYRAERKQGVYLIRGHSFKIQEMRRIGDYVIREIFQEFNYKTRLDASFTVLLNVIEVKYKKWNIKM
jgi:hypothetical protein